MEARAAEARAAETWLRPHTAAEVAGGYLPEPGRLPKQLVVNNE